MKVLIIYILLLGAIWLWAWIFAFLHDSVKNLDKMDKKK